MKSRFLFLILALGLATASGQARSLTIIHTNDTHSHIDPFMGYGDVPNVGGVIERAAFIDSVRRADGRRNVLVLDAGDISQGSSYFTLLEGSLESSIVRDMGVDAMSLGNHEFDNGPLALAGRLKLQRPVKVVCANYDFGSLEIARHINPYAIFRRGGFKIGVIGLLPDISSLVQQEHQSSLTALNTPEVVGALAMELREKKHCDLVICLTHIGYEREKYCDTALAAETRGVDIIVGGHSHTFLDSAVTVNNLDGDPVTIVTDGCWGEYVGVLKISK